MTLQFQRSGVKNCLPFLFTFELAPSPEFFGDVANRWSYFFLSLKKVTNSFQQITVWRMISEAGKIPWMQENFKNWWNVFITVLAKINIAKAGSILIN